MIAFLWGVLLIGLLALAATFVIVALVAAIFFVGCSLITFIDEMRGEPW